MKYEGLKFEAIKHGIILHLRKGCGFPLRYIIYVHTCKDLLEMLGKSSKHILPNGGAKYGNLPRYKIKKHLQQIQVYIIIKLEAFDKTHVIFRVIRSAI